MSDKSKNQPPETTGPNGKYPQNDKGYQTIDIVPRRNHRLLIVVMVLLVGAIAVLGFYIMKVHAKLGTADAATQQANQDLAASQKDLQNFTTASKTERETEQAKCKETEQALEAQVAGLETALKNTQTTVGELKDEKQQATRELAQFKAFSAQFKRMTDAGKLEVVFRHGRMVINLPAQVLFSSGSADLSVEGHNALKEVAEVLRTVKNKRFVVGGHTDDQQIKKAKFESNWELSSARALVVTKDLILAGLKPWNLVAAGYSQYAPIASNNSEQGRQTNRRIEIVLEPYLKDIKPPKIKSEPAASKKKAAKNSKAEKK